MSALQILGQFARLITDPALIGFSLLMFLTPGPNNVMLTATGVNFGIRRGLPHWFGVCGGFTLMFAIVATGLATALNTHAYALDIIRVLGLGMLLFLAYKIATTKPQPTDPENKTSQSATTKPGTTTKPGNTKPGTTKPNTTKPISFLQAATFQWVNPKSWIACATLSSLFLGGSGLQQDSAALHAVPLAMVLFCLSIPSAFCWLLFGVQIRKWLAAPTQQIIVNRVMAILLVLVGLSFFL